MELVNNYPNVCQALEGQKFQKLAQVRKPERVGVAQSSTTSYRFDLQEVGDGPATGKLLLFDAQGAAYQAVKNFNQTAGISAYRVKPRGAGNLAAEAVEYEQLIDVARSMLSEGLAARIKALSGGSVNYLIYGGEKLKRYDLDPQTAAALNIPTQGAVSSQQAAPQDVLAQSKKTIAMPIRALQPTRQSMMRSNPP